MKYEKKILLKKCDNIYNCIVEDEYSAASLHTTQLGKMISDNLRCKK